MSTQITVVSQKYENEYKNDPGFVSNPGDVTPNLAMSIMENVKLTRQIDVSWGFSASASNPLPSVVIIVAGNTMRFTLPSSKTWAGESFAIGDVHFVTWSDNAGPNSSLGTVQSLTGNIMIMSNMTIGPINGWTNNTTTFRGTNNIEALVYGFGLVDNTENAIVIASAVSGNDQQYYTDGIGLGGPRSTLFVPMQSKGQYLDWVTGSMRIRFVSAQTSGGNVVVQRFEVEHEFMINPYFLDGELTNLQNNVIPN